MRVAGAVAVLILSVVVGAYGGYVVGYRSGEQSAADRPGLPPEFVPVPMEVSEPVAIVGGVHITSAKLLSRVASAGSVKATLDRMIDEKIIDLAAEQASVTVTEAELDVEIKRIEQKVGGVGHLRTIMSRYNYDVPNLRADQRTRLQLRRILGGDIPVTDEVLKQHFLDRFDLLDKREIHSRHILVKTEREALAVRSELLGGADFGAVARRKSIDPAVKENGGDYGFTRRNMMVPEYEKVAFGLPVGEISEPVKSDYGYHIIQVLDTRGEPPSFEAVKDEVRRMYFDEKVNDRTQAWLDAQRARVEIIRLLQS